MLHFEQRPSDRLPIRSSIHYPRSTILDPLRSTLRSAPIKGPGYRLDLDARRTWQCPACGQRWKTPGDVVATDCTACGDRPAMKLVEDFPPRRSLRHSLATVCPPPAETVAP
ncbi:MAG: hypothetical protein WD069_13815 [Planctomycetales bacterium]